MSSDAVVVAMIVAAFGTFMVTLAGAHLYVLLDPKTRKRQAQVVQFEPASPTPARRRTAAHA